MELLTVGRAYQRSDLVRSYSGTNRQQSAVGGILDATPLRVSLSAYPKNRTGGIPMPLIPTHRDASVTFFG